MANNQSHWNKKHPDKGASLKEIQVWKASLEFDRDKLQALFQTLSSEEVTRANKMYFERDRNRFIAAHGVLRCLLGLYLDRNPQDLQFQVTNKGKPFIESTGEVDDIRFNIAHSGAVALYAFARGRNVGIDVEELRQDVNIQQIAQRFYAAREVYSITKCLETERTELFFQYWTRKEAFIKCLGEGMSFPLEKCDVSGMGNGLSHFLIEGNAGSNSGWYGIDIFPGEGFVGAVAAQGDDWIVSCWDYSLHFDLEIKRHLSF